MSANGSEPPAPEWARRLARNGADVVLLLESIVRQEQHRHEEVMGMLMALIHDAKGSIDFTVPGVGRAHVRRQWLIAAGVSVAGVIVGWVLRHLGVKP